MRYAVIRTIVFVEGCLGAQKDALLLLTCIVVADRVKCIFITFVFNAFLEVEQIPGK
jgi:hypothetical protein